MNRYNASEIIAGLKSKDPAIFRFLYREYGKMIVGYVRKNRGSEEDARETVQKVMVALWQAVDEDRYEESGKMDRYIYQLTSNAWRLELRRRRRNPEADIESAGNLIALHDDTTETIQAAKHKNNTLEAMHNALESMAEPCKTIIQHYHLKEVALQELAERMAYDYNNLRKRIFDCRKKLKSLIEQQFLNANLPNNGR